MGISTLACRSSGLKNARGEEGQLILALRRQGINFERATREEDARGIDLWIQLEKDGKFFPFQVKSRLMAGLQHLDITIQKGGMIPVLVPLNGEFRHTTILEACARAQEKGIAVCMGHIAIRNPDLMAMNENISALKEQIRYMASLQNLYRSKS